MAIITISRQVGSWGDEIAELAAERLGYRLIGREAIHQAAKDCDQDFKKACSIYEAETRPAGFFERVFFSDAANVALFEMLNYELAGQGEVIMLGRGAHLALAGIEGVLKCRIVAPIDLRAKRIAEKKGVPLDEAAEFVDRYGRRRRALIESMYNVKLSDWSQYDLIVNTAALTAAEAAEIIAGAAEKLDARSDAEATRKMLADLAFAKRIELQIKKAITTLAHRDVRVSVDGGVVTLSGVVSDKANRAKAEEIAAGVEGVREVVNNLGTTELSF